MSYSSITTNLGLRLIDYASDPYHEDEWFNLRLIDGALELNQVNQPFAVATGSGSAYVADYTPDQTLAVGLTLVFIAPAANTGAVTLAVDGQAAKAIKINGADPSANSITSGMLVKVVYDGTNFNVIYPVFQTTVAQRITVGASGATVDALADEFVVENSANVGMSLLSPNATTARIFFGSVSKPDAGGFAYDHSADRLYLRAGQAQGAYVGTDKIIRQPDAPLVNAYITYAATAAPANGTVIIFNTEVVDTTNSYNNASGVFTAPVAGTYECSVANEFIGSSNVREVMAFYKNGVQVTPTFNLEANSTGYFGHLHRTFITLAVGDTVDFRMVTLAATNLTGRLELTIKLVA